MTPPILFATFFEGAGPNAAFYHRMARVLDYTARKHCPEWSIEVKRIANAGHQYGDNHSLASNTHKLDHWNRRIQASQDGDRALLIDGDMMIVRNLDPIWDLEFDVAYTVKKSKLPFNGGVLFLRVSDRTKRFMQAYWDRNVEFLGNPAKHAPFRSKFAGMNQAAFGSLLEQIEPLYRCKLLGVQCAEWNAEQSVWPNYNPELARIVHVKSALRKALFGRTECVDDFLRPLMKIWRDYEQEALLTEVAAR